MLFIYFNFFHRPIPDKDFVEAYMKAFYLNEVDLENWVKEHKVKEMSLKVVTMIIKLCPAVMNRPSGFSRGGVLCISCSSVCGLCEGDD